MKKTETVKKTVKKVNTVKKAAAVKKSSVVENEATQISHVERVADKPKAPNKGTGLFKIVMFILFAIAILTWVFSASYFTEGSMSELGMQNIGFFDFFQLLFGSFEFEFFIQIFILLISIGALYGVLGKTGKYRAWIERIVANLAGREKIFILIVALIITVITSLFDYGFATFIFIPFILSILLAIGYDKVTSCLATFGAMLIGIIGSTIGYNTSGVISGLLSTKATDGIVFKIVLLVLSFVALAVFINFAKINKKEKADEEEDMFIGEKNSNKFSLAPIIIIFSVLFVLLILGCTNWESTFNVKLFSNINDSITNFTVKLPHFHVTADGIDSASGDVAIFAKLLGTVSAFGKWYYAEMALMCLLASLLLGRLYKNKLRDTFANMAEGAKKMLKPALLVMFIYTVIFFAGNTMIFPTIAQILLSITSKFNVLISAIVVAIGSALNVDMLYLSNYLVPQLAAQDVSTTVVAILTQGIYGVTMFVAPTSAVIAFGLSYLNISYKEWIKKTWKLILVLLAIVLAVSLAAVLI